MEISFAGVFAGRFFGVAFSFGAIDRDGEYFFFIWGRIELIFLSTGVGEGYFGQTAHSFSCVLVGHQWVPDALTLGKLIFQLYGLTKQHLLSVLAGSQNTLLLALFFKQPRFGVALLQVRLKGLSLRSNRHRN